MRGSTRNCSDPNVLVAVAVRLVLAELELSLKSADLVDQPHLPHCCCVVLSNPSL